MSMGTDLVEMRVKNLEIEMQGLLNFLFRWCGAEEDGPRPTLSGLPADATVREIWLRPGRVTCATLLIESAEFPLLSLVDLDGLDQVPYFDVRISEPSGAADDGPADG